MKDTYVSCIYNYRLLKEELYYVKITLSRNKLEWNKNAESPALNLLETKILPNSTILDTDCRSSFI